MSKDEITLTEFSTAAAKISFRFVEPILSSVDDTKFNRLG
jgi:hypothetical protein